MSEPLDLCPFCGAYSPRKCELLDETGGDCPWEDMQDDDVAAGAYSHQGNPLSAVLAEALASSPYQDVKEKGDA